MVEHNGPCVPYILRKLAHHKSCIRLATLTRSGHQDPALPENSSMKFAVKIVHHLGWTLLSTVYSLRNRYALRQRLGILAMARWEICPAGPVCRFPP
jgi:hypothetical protein